MHKTLLLCICWLNLNAASSDAFQDVTLDGRAQQLLQKSQKLLKMGKTREAHAVLKEARALQITLADQLKTQGRKHAKWGEWDAAQALDVEFLGHLPKSLSTLQYLIPNKHRQNMSISQKPATESATRVTIPYMGKKTNDMTYLEIDTSHLPPGVHKLILTARDFVGESSATQTTLFRIVP